MPQSWGEIQRARAARRSKARRVEQEAAQSPELPPSSTVGETLFQAGSEGALPIGVGAIPQGIWRMGINAPQGFTRALSGLQHGEGPGEIAQGVVSNVLANKEGVIAKGKFFGKDVEIRGPKPERLSLDDIFRVGGIPELGRPSDVPLLGLAYTESGKGLPLQREGILDPSVRGVAGFVGETATSPLSYLRIAQALSVGVARTPAGKVIAKVHPTKLGQAAFNAFRKKELARRFGPAAEAIETKLSLEVIEDIRDSAATRLYEAAQKAPELLDKAALYLGPVRLGGTRVIDAATKLRTRVAQRLNTFEPWRKTTEVVADKARSLERLWSVVPAAARKFPQAEENVSRYFADRRNIVRESRQQIRSWMKGLMHVKVQRGPHKGMPMAEYVRHNIDNPDMYPDSVLPVAVKTVADDVRAWEGNMFQVEAGYGLRDPAQMRPNYLTHRYLANGKPISRAMWDKLGGEEAIQFQSGQASQNIGGTTLARTFPTYDAALQALNQRAAERGLKVTITAAPLEESLLHRAYNHADAVAFAKMEGRFLKDFGVDADQAADEHFATILPELAQIVYKGEAAVSADYVQNAAALKTMLLSYARRAGLPATDAAAQNALKESARNAARFQLLAPSQQLLKKLAREDKLTKAFYWVSRLKTASGREEFEKLLLDKPKLGDIDDQLVSEITKYVGVSREQWTNKMRDQFGEVMVQWKGRTKPMYLPAPLAEELGQLSKTGAIDEDLMAAMNIYDTATTLYKGLVTSHVPSFNTRNAYSNLATSYLELGMTALNPARGQRSMAILRGAEGTLQVPNGRYSYSQFRDAARQYGILNEQDFALESVAMPAHAKILERFPFKQGRQIGTGLENWSKMSLMLGHVERGASLEAAAWRTQQTLFDYDYLSNFSRQHVRRIFPFSTWYLKNAALTGRLLVREPGRMYQLERFNEMQHADRAPDNAALPDYLEGRFHLRTAKKGKTTFWYGLDLPHRAFLDNVYMGDNAFQKTLKANASLLHPALKAVAAATTGHDPVTEQSINAPREVSEGWAAMIRALPQDTKDWMEFRETQRGGETKWQMNGTKAYLFFNVLAADRILWPVAAYGEARKKDYDIDNALLDIATGINTETLDLTEVQRRLYNQRLREAEERLIRDGKRRRIDITIEAK